MSATTKKSLTREKKVFKELAATGRYVNTGKVLIGLTYVPRSPECVAAAMTQGEHLAQTILLGNPERSAR